jgi:hypothetical protein
MNRVPFKTQYCHRKISSKQGFRGKYSLGPGRRPWEQFLNLFQDLKKDQTEQEGNDQRKIKG